MGCKNAKIKEDKAKLDVEILDDRRKRLSLGDIDGTNNNDTYNNFGGQVSDNDRSLLLKLSGTQVLEYVKSLKGADSDSPLFGKTFSIGSETDKEMQRKLSFRSKQTRHAGETFDAAKSGVGFACKKGLKPESPNQDSFFIMQVEGYLSLYGVFDGHGRKGHDVSNFVKDSLPKLLLSQSNLETDPMDALAAAFASTQLLIEKATHMSTIDAARSGTTASVLLHNHKEKTMYVAHVGDSRVVLGRLCADADANVDAVGSKKWEAVDLTQDHKPNDPVEKARIEKAGGMVVFDGGWNYRVYVKGKRDDRGKSYPGLNMSRSMGDLLGSYDAGISAIPDINDRTISMPNGDHSKPNGDPAKRRKGSDASVFSHTSSGSTPSVSSRVVDNTCDKFVLLCSDGVWEFVSSLDAVLAVGAFPKEEATAAAEHIASVAFDRWMQEMDGQVVDDITALVVYL